MKRTILPVTLFILTFQLTMAQDLIVLSAGDSIACYIQKKDDQFIYFQRLESSKVEMFGRGLIKEQKEGFFGKYDTEDSRKNQTEEYCLILASGQLFSTKVTISIDFGQERKFFSDSKLKDKSGQAIKFNSVIDALNYMNSLGWEFVDAYTITIGNSHVYHYLMKRKIQGE